MGQRAVIGFLFLLAVSSGAYGQAHASEGFGVCKPISQRTTELGCWIIGDHPIGRFDQAKVFWYLDAYPSRTAAERANGKSGVVVEALGKVWLLTVAAQDSQGSTAGKRIAKIGPLPVHQGQDYSALYMEAVMNPGMTSAVHTHSGPEAWYTESGETCLETPSGKIVGRPGETPAIVPEGSPMLLTATGKEQRRALVLILHDSAKPPTTPEHSWKPKGLCRP